ncbi:hypothetical protein, partial [Microcoleus sp.]|uniref:hypothetical protein n=1 Tax=Microcoleus sp. TaxID=44472 RepID=UPI00403EEF8F
SCRAFKLYIQGGRDTPQEFDCSLTYNLNVEQLKSSERLNPWGAECESKSCEPRFCKASIY